MFRQCCFPQSSAGLATRFFITMPRLCATKWLPVPTASEIYTIVLANFCGVVVKTFHRLVTSSRVKIEDRK